MRLSDYQLNAVAPKLLAAAASSGALQSSRLQPSLTLSKWWNQFLMTGPVSALGHQVLRRPSRSLRMSTLLPTFVPRPDNDIPYIGDQPEVSIWSVRRTSLVRYMTILFVLGPAELFGGGTTASRGLNVAKVPTSLNGSQPARKVALDCWGQV